MTGIFFLNSCKFWKKGDTGNVRESKKAKKGVHIFSMCRGRYCFISKGRQYGPVVTALALRSGDPGFMTRSDHSLNVILVVPAWFNFPAALVNTPSQLGFLTVVLFCRFVVFHWPRKAPMGSRQLSMYCIV